MTITSRQRTAGGGNGVHRQLQRPLLARRHSGGGPRALFRLAARDLRRCASGTARDRSLRARLSRRAALALRAQRALSQFLRHLRPSRDRADQAAIGGRPARRHPDLLLHPGYPSPESAAGRGVDAPPGLRSLRRLRHLSRISSRAFRRRHLQAARQHLSGHAAVLASVATRRAKPDRVRREHVGLRARQRGRRLFQRLSRLPGRGMHLRSRRADAQGQPVRPASQIRRRHACRRGRGASRRHAPSPRRGMRRAAAIDAPSRTGLNRAWATVSAWALCALPLLLLAAPARAQTEPVSFAGKQIKLMIGYSPTGYGYDTYSRLIARHLGKYLPGNPAIIPQNRPGAGSLNLANYLYYAAAKDGTEIAMIGRGVAMEPLIGATQTKFDARSFVWLGSMNNEVSGFFIRQGAPAANLQEILAGTALTVGSTGAGGDQQAFTVALNSLIGTKLKPIAGYPGTQEIMLAIERGELDGIVGYSWGVARVGNRDDLASGRLKIVMQLGLAKHKELPDVPTLDAFVTAAADRQVLELIFSRQAMGRPLIAPPGLPPQVVEALRWAFASSMRDPQLLD